MRFTIVLGQRVSWPEMLARTRETEELGFDGLYVVDHFFGRVDIHEPTHEAWTMLAALAPFTQRLRLGVMVCGNTYRNPAFLLKQAVTVDHISGGRVDFGVGAGWLEREHEAYGFEYPSAGQRVERFAEALEIWDQLQSSRYTTYEGRHYQLLDAPFEPKPLQSPRLPVIIGASGPRMLRLVARHADEWNTVASPDEGASGNARLDIACREIGREPASLKRSVSPSINLLASVDAFEAGVESYRQAGFDHITFPWPRVPEEVPVLREVARLLLPGLRDRAPSRAPAGIETGVTIPDDAVAEAIGRMSATERAFLSVVAEHPDEVRDGDAIREALGFARHDQVTRTAASIGRIFAELGLDRPWTETQRGYSMSQAQADRVRESLTHTGPG